MKEIGYWIFAVLISCLAALLMVLCIDTNPSRTYKPDSCDEVTYGDFGERLCGYNIRMICFEPKPYGQRSYYEDLVCKKYFQIKGLN